MRSKLSTVSCVQFNLGAPYICSCETSKLKLSHPFFPRLIFIGAKYKQCIIYLAIHHTYLPA